MNSRQGSLVLMKQGIGQNSSLKDLPSRPMKHCERRNSSESGCRVCVLCTSHEKRDYRRQDDLDKRLRRSVPDNKLHFC